MRETASAVLRWASPAERDAWCKAFGHPSSVPRQRGQTPKAAGRMHQAYMEKLEDAFGRSFGRAPTGQQSHDVPLLSFAEGGTRQVLTQTAKRLGRHWARASWYLTAVYLPTRAAKREYDVCHDAVQQADRAWDSALAALDAAGEPVRELLHATRDEADRSGGAEDAFVHVSLMRLMIEDEVDEAEWSNFTRDLRRSNQGVRLELIRSRRNPFNEAARSSFTEACRALQARLLAVPGVAGHPAIAAYNDALEVVPTTRHRLDTVYTALWQQGERIVVLLSAKGEYRDPNDLTVRLRSREAQVRGVPVVRVTFERSESRERLLQTGGQAYHDHFQTDTLS